MNEVEKKVERQLDHIISNYHDQPKEFKFKLKSLIIEWYEKGLNAIQGITLTCPHCEQASTVYHLQWSAIKCMFCKQDVEIEEWVKKSTLRRNSE